MSPIRGGWIGRIQCPVCWTIIVSASPTSFPLPRDRSRRCSFRIEFSHDPAPYSLPAVLAISSLACHRGCGSGQRAVAIHSLSRVQPHPGAWHSPSPKLPFASLYSHAWQIVRRACRTARGVIFHPARRALSNSIRNRFALVQMLADSLGGEIVGGNGGGTSISGRCVMTLTMVVTTSQKYRNLHRSGRCRSIPGCPGSLVFQTEARSNTKRTDQLRTPGANR